MQGRTASNKGSKLVIFLSEGFFSSFIVLRSEGDKEKNAISDAEAKPDISSSNPARTMAMIAEKEGVCTVIPVKTSANWLKNVSESKDMGFS